jgi:16S rRNA C1402 N4-methylase RsmH
MTEIKFAPYAGSFSGCDPIPRTSGRVVPTSTAPWALQAMRARLPGCSGRSGHLIGFDRDPKALELAGERLKALKKSWASDAEGDADWRGLQPGGRACGAGKSLDGLLADFGVSSMQIDEPERGFSFQADGPLDMRQDTRQG